jgi:DNA-binding transcriptional ArsR family regulator
MTTRSLDQTLLALADPTRRAVVELLLQKPHRAGELAGKLEMSAPALSRHLRTLRESGLIEETDVKDDARVKLLQLRRERFTELKGWLETVESFWGSQLESFKAHVEKKNRHG